MMDRDHNMRPGEADTRTSNYNVRTSNAESVAVVQRLSTYLALQMNTGGGGGGGQNELVLRENQLLPLSSGGERGKHTVAPSAL